MPILYTFSLSVCFCEKVLHMQNKSSRRLIKFLENTMETRSEFLICCQWWLLATISYLKAHCNLRFAAPLSPTGFESNPLLKKGASGHANSHAFWRKDKIFGAPGRRLWRRRHGFSASPAFPCRFSFSRHCLFAAFGFSCFLILLIF